MLACARIGAPHSVVFGGFSAEAVKDRINDCEAKVARDGRLLAAARQAAADEGVDRQGAAGLPLDRALRRRAPHRRRRAVDRGPRRLVARGGRGRLARLPGRAVRRRADALPALHLGHDREAEGHRAHDRRLPDRRRGHAQAGLRHQARDATSTGARPTSAGSPATATSSTGRSPTAARRSSTRARPTIPDKDRWWEIVERYKAHDLLHRADGDPRLHQVGPRVPRPPRPQSRCGCSAASASRSTRARGSGTTR